MPRKHCNVGLTDGDEDDGDTLLTQPSPGDKDGSDPDHHDDA